MERALLGAGAAGDRAAGEALLARMLPGIFGLCRRILGREDAAQDAAQETSARLCAQVRRGDPRRAEVGRHRGDEPVLRRTPSRACEVPVEEAIAALGIGFTTDSVIEWATGAPTLRTSDRTSRAPPPKSRANEA